MQRPGQLLRALLTTFSKLNTREANPNEYITFIRSLQNRPNSEDAEHILKAIAHVAAQVRKIMAARYMLIGTLEEAAYNGVFAGRNWNHGQTVELVLRRPNGQFYPLSYMLSVMAHEHMNHGPEFQKVGRGRVVADGCLMPRFARTSQICARGDTTVMASGHMDIACATAPSSAQLDSASELPQYVCGVTKSDARRAGSRRRRPASSRGPGMVKGVASHLSGAQTEKRSKPGQRNTIDMGLGSGRVDGREELTKEDHELRKAWIEARVEALVRQGVEVKKARRRAVDAFNKANPRYRAGSTRGKQAGSKAAAQDRAALFERLLSRGAPSVKEEGLAEVPVKQEPVKEVDDSGEGEDSDEDDIEIIEDPHLSLEERRKELDADREEEPGTSAGGLRPEWKEFLAEAAQASAKRDASVRRRHVPSSRSSRSPQGNAKPTTQEVIEVADSSDEELREYDRPPKRLRMVKDEAGSSEPLHTSSHCPTSSSIVKLDSDRDRIRERRLRAFGQASSTPSGTSQRATSPEAAHKAIKLEDGSEGWICGVCSLENSLSQTRCGVCEACPDGTGSIAQ
ncbi:unnamed protein product [Cutaneotrichosporon oleaginosum]